MMIGLADSRLPSEIDALPPMNFLYQQTIPKVEQSLNRNAMDSNSRVLSLVNVLVSVPPIE